jgi:S-adenosylmethionine:tRNA ribosyltransferase-isomerase
MLTSDFDYELPATAIAQTPLEPRHASRLLDARDLTDHVFLDLPGLLAPGDLVVVNRSRVRHARLLGHKRDTGGAVEALVLRRVDGDRWRCLVRPARRIHRGTLLVFGDLQAEVLDDPVDGVVEVRFDPGAGDVEAAFRRLGELPLPPYLTTAPADPDRYQTIFAAEPGSAAAPTAGLHFTDELVDRLGAAGIQLASIDLEVGLATFRPVSTPSIEAHEMHAEAFRVDGEAAEAVTACRGRGGRVVAIGTTVARALETVGRQDGTIEPGSGETRLYLRPGSRFRVVDVLVTNFHLPRSSLLVLLEAFMGPAWRDVYRAALERGYRFLSLGDAMLCTRNPA